MVCFIFRRKRRNFLNISKINFNIIVEKKEKNLQLLRDLLKLWDAGSSFIKD